MTNKKALSALVDGEVSEVEIHRLVREFGFNVPDDLPVVLVFHRLPQGIYADLS